jgi:hypothetical protein
MLIKLRTLVLSLMLTPELQPLKLLLLKLQLLLRLLLLQLKELRPLQLRLLLLQRLLQLLPLCN